MQANFNQWYVQWFIWSCRAMDRWGTDRNRESNARRNGTNLCQFFRILLWGAMISTWSIALWAYMAFVVLVLPFILFNVTSIAMIAAIVVAAAAAIIGLLFALFAIPDAARWVGSRMSRITDVNDRDQPLGFFQVCWQYIAGIKKRFCPTITFKETDNA
jgi:hypothetical protein